MQIPKIAYKDFLINQKEPKRTDKNYVSFWLKHIEYCRSGVSVGGIYISGWLYWHLNFFIIPTDVKDDYGNWTRVKTHPTFRDNEWYIDWGIRKAQEQQKPIIIFGSRRISKSVTIASRAAYSAFIKPNSATIIIGADSNDLANITEYLDDFYEKRPDCFSDLRKFGTWLRNTGAVEIAFSKREVTKKDIATGKKGEINPITSKLMEVGSENKYIYSRVAIRNLEHGQKTTKEELLAGLTPTEVILDECGKFGYSLAMSALKPALKTSDGSFRCSVILAGTGGNIDVSSDAEKDFLNSDKSGYTHIDVNEYKDIVKDEYFKYEQLSNAMAGLFPPAQMSNAGGKKLPIPFSEYLKKDFTAKEIKDLEGFDIAVTDWENAKEMVAAEIVEEEFKSDKHGKKAQMYYPSQPEDCFLHSGNNPFPVEDAKKMQKIIEEKGLQGSYYKLSQNENGIVLNETDKTPIDKYPYEGGAYDAPVVILEPPIAEPKNIKRGTYVAGFDGYKVEESQTTDSVGSMYIYKRKVGLTGYQDKLVAYYASRPERFEDFHFQVLYLLKLYNPELLPETDSNLYNFLRQHNATKYLADCRSLVEGITPNTKAFMNYGLPATKKNQDHYMKLIVDYTQENILEGYDEDGNEIYVKGIYRIEDPMLLEEMIKFGKQKNFDRIISFGHALAWNAEMENNKIHGGIQEERETAATVNGIIAKSRLRRIKWS